MRIYSIKTVTILSALIASSMLGYHRTSRCAWGSETQATRAELLTVMPGFEVELIHSARPDEGSWISMTFDPKGRILLADDNQGLMRMTSSVAELKATSRIENDRTKLGGETSHSQAVVQMARLENTGHLKHCRGILYAHDSLYVSETNGAGIHRLQDLDDDGVFEVQKLIIPLIYESRYGHGANQIRLGPDQSVYVTIGNDVFYPENISKESPYKGTKNDWLLPNPHDGEPDARSGFILKISPDGTERVVLNGGLRNQVDIDFNSDGEMFTWDADMEWDVGQPWYRPTRINHVVSGGEYGWRWGTGKWPNWYPDSLPSNHDTGLGSPTGVTFGTRSNWPNRFKDALFAADWQHGRILMIDMLESGASYTGQSYVFAEGSPLNVSDMEFGPDGNLYFITGGRGSQSGLYRIKYVGRPNTTSGSDTVDTLPSLPPKSADAAKARELRKDLEKWHTRVSDEAIDNIWTHLGSADVWIRFAARVALENQPTERWLSKFEAEDDPATLLTAGMALARSDSENAQDVAVKRLLSLKPLDLQTSDRMWWLRVLQLTILRHGKPDADLCGKLVQAIESIPETDHFPTHWLSGELLVALESPQAVPFLVKLLGNAPTQEEQIQHAKTLMRTKTTWSTEERNAVAEWLLNNRKLPGGRLIEATLTALQQDFIASFNSEEAQYLQDFVKKLGEPVPAATDDAADATAQLHKRSIVQLWDRQAIESGLKMQSERTPDLERGKRIAVEAQCLRCHVIGERGSHIGPDLSSVGKRFDQGVLIESIVEPSKQVDPKYAISNYRLTDGRVITGRAASVTGKQLIIEVNPLTGEGVTIDRSEIEETRLSSLSPMPSGLLDTFSIEEIADLLAYLKNSNQAGDPTQNEPVAN